MLNITYAAGKVDNVFPRPVKSDTISDVNKAINEEGSLYIKLSLCNAYSDTNEYIPWSMGNQNENQLGELNSARSKMFALVITRKCSRDPLLSIYAKDIETVVDKLKARNVKGTLLVSLFSDKTSHSNKTLRLLLK